MYVLCSFNRNKQQQQQRRPPHATKTTTTLTITTTTINTVLLSTLPLENGTVGWRVNSVYHRKNKKNNTQNKK